MFSIQQNGCSNGKPFDMQERILKISPDKIDVHRQEVEERFRRWHREKYFLIDYEWFRTISNASFLAHIGYIVTAALPEGLVNLNLLEQTLRERLGEYFSSERFEKAIAFAEEEQWEFL